MKRFLVVVLAIIGIVGIVFLLGPRPDTNHQITFQPSALGDDLDAYLSRSEATIPNLVEGAQKEIIWADASTRAKTAISVVYVHGFSATKMETRPVPDKVANALGANLYFARLKGHGRNGAGLATASLQDWVNDMAEAIAIGRKIGEKIILVSTSTGGALSTLAASNRDMARDIAGLVMISPNYEVQAINNTMFNMPWAETILPKLMGEHREWKPDNEEHGKWWTTSYPSVAAIPMAALLRVTEETDPSSIDAPALFIYSKQDKVVVPEKTVGVISKWGGPTKVINVENSDDDNHHVITGDIRSPSTNQFVIDAILEWASTLSREEQ